MSPAEIQRTFGLLKAASKDPGFFARSAPAVQQAVRAGLGHIAGPGVANTAGALAGLATKAAPVLGAGALASLALGKAEEKYESPEVQRALGSFKGTPQHRTKIEMLRQQSMLPPGYY